MVLFRSRKGSAEGDQMPWIATGDSRAMWSRNTTELFALHACECQMVVSIGMKGWERTSEGWARTQLWALLLGFSELNNNAGKPVYLNPAFFSICELTEGSEVRTS